MKDYNLPGQLDIDFTPEFKVNQTVPVLDEFKRNGYTYKKIDETDQYYIYEVQRSLGVHYEMFERGHRYTTKPGRLSSSIKNGQEYYPNDSDFGIWSWCCNTKERAYELVELFSGERSAKKPRSHLS